MSKFLKVDGILPVVHAEIRAEEIESKNKASAPKPEEPEEPEEPVDPKPQIDEECGETLKCKPLKAHYEECTRRVEEGSNENCSEELYHFLHCVDSCTAPKIFAQLK
ncbi:hypothetical protein G9A89_019099 [Geosiphon pyriformis]|nr:hypothetical protein G9A89_019099 [Geosiphon pyriformis]